MSRGIPVPTTVCGIEYDSGAEMCREREINEPSYKYRIQKGKTPQEAYDRAIVNKELGFRRHGAQEGCFDYKGQHFVSVREMCRHYEISYETYKKRKSLGWSLEKTLTTKTQKPEPLYSKALRTMLASRFIAKAEDIGRPLTDNEVMEEARYQLEDLPYKPDFQGKELTKAKREMRALLRRKMK